MEFIFFKRFSYSCLLFGTSIISNSENGVLPAVTTGKPKPVNSIATDPVDVIPAKQILVRDFGLISSGQSLIFELS